MGKLRDYIPALKYGHKIEMSDTAGIGVKPYVGNIYYVDADSGSDTANSGTSWNDAFATLGAAYTACTTNNYDMIVVAPNGTSSTTESAIAWSKNHITTIGASAYSPFSPRSRALWKTADDSPALTISGQGNTFSNVQLGTFVDLNVLVSLTGDRNSFHGVHFAGIGDATAGDDAAARCISMSGAEENYFNGCTIGLDTVARSTTNAELELASGSTRNVFEGCRFVSFADNAGHLFVKAASAADVDRFVEFKDCTFHNATNSTATAMTVAMDLHASLGGSVLLFNSWLFGATDWADDFTNVEVAGGVQATGATAGLFVAAA